MSPENWAWCRGGIVSDDCEEVVKARSCQMFKKKKKSNNFIIPRTVLHMK